MRISRISVHHAPLVAFSAKTKITAPSSLLSKEDKEYFEQLGKKLNLIRIQLKLGFQTFIQAKQTQMFNAMM